MAVIMRPTFAGIDFGTSNSTVAIAENGAARLVPLEQGRVTLPSALFFNFVGNTANTVAFYDLRFDNYLPQCR